MKQLLSFFLIFALMLVQTSFATTEANHFGSVDVEYVAGIPDYVQQITSTDVDDYSYVQSNTIVKEATYMKVSFIVENRFSKEINKNRILERQSEGLKKGIGIVLINNRYSKTSFLKNKSYTEIGYSIAYTYN